MTEGIVVGNPENRRVALFLAAAEAAGCSRPRVLSWQAILDGSASLEEWVTPDTTVRLESPGENFAVERELIARGAALTGRIDPGEVRRTPPDQGRIWLCREWFLGWRRQLQGWANLPVRWMNPPADIVQMFDKPACQQHLAGLGVIVPEQLGRIRDWDDLRRRMRDRGLSRVFVKLASGSSASGVIALRTSSTAVQATTSVEMVAQPAGPPALYNSLRVRTYTSEREVGLLVDTLAAEEIYAERWLPKAGWQGRTFDLRVMVIAGQVRQMVMRTSQTPLTNLHLGNARGDLAAFLQQTPPARLEPAWETCRRVAGAFPRSLYLGVDLLLGPGLGRHAVMEVNAFGDLLPGVEIDGRDSYQDEVAAQLQRGGGQAGTSPATDPSIGWRSR
ncbi:STM4014 family protein [Lignipirellula cremea]|uniref:ATP-grasp domain-containing protein n=1 Tax=Lignipirellula cremea TaxID=2528010 RepID=A0A518DNG1_9BACT|nr:STM4014 family protein [Lignipirellula cremea]QDU93372.1 hypothetical protein Pla8534_11520 [Lignipirellula cremea]